MIWASLLQVLFTIRSKRQLVEHLRYSLLYRWFVGLKMDDAVWHHVTFSKNRERLLDESSMSSLFKSTLKIAKRHWLLSSEHFSDDGTLIDTWVSHKSFKPKDGKDDDDGQSGRKERDFRTERRSTRNTARRGGSAIDERTTRHADYDIRQRKRKMIETTFGWAKQYGGLRRMMYRGIEKVHGQMKLVVCAFNLLRIGHVVPMEVI